jgi:hypothetical protein
MTQDEVVYKQLARSGFPFQLRVERVVLSTEGHHGWGIVTREHGWVHPETRSSGFIDLVLQHHQYSTLRLVVECKRQRRDDLRALQWLFLIPTEEAITTDAVRCLSLEAWRSSEQLNILRAWDDVRITPHSLESQFCVLQSDEARRQPILESLCGELLASIDGLAEEEINIVKSQISYAQVRAFYIPAVITNAHLKVCLFDVDSISLSDGVIPEDKCKVKTVPFIRFRKSLTNLFPDDEPLSTLKETNQARERTVFVVNSESLKEFLTGWNILPMDAFDGYAIQQRRRR